MTQVNKKYFLVLEGLAFVLHKLYTLAQQQILLMLLLVLFAFHFFMLHLLAIYTYCVSSSLQTRYGSCISKNVTVLRHCLLHQPEKKKKGLGMDSPREL